MITYKDIQGWFSEESFYSRIVAEAPNTGLFVEVGCWLGRSTCFLAHAIKATRKNISIVAVDTWRGTQNEPALMEAVRQVGGSMFKRFWRNMRAAHVTDVVTPLMLPSVRAAKVFENSCLDFVFIDADHSYEAVKADVLAWKPKVKRGGVLAGHDWCTYDSVRRAVRDILGARITSEGNVWIHQCMDRRLR